MKKFLIIVLIFVLCIFCISRCMGEDSDNSGTEVVEIEKFSTTEYIIHANATQTFSLKIKKKDVSLDSVSCEILNEQIATIENLKIVSNRSDATLTFDVVAKSIGETSLKVYSKADETLCSSTSLKIVAPPIISKFSSYSTKGMYLEEGDTRNISITVEPSNVKETDFEFIISNEECIEISNVQTENQENNTIISFDVLAKKVGNGYFSIKATDDRSNSSNISFNIQEKDTSRTVYVTPLGKKYHYSASCAGEHATSTTLNQARKTKSPCSKCVH